MSVRDIKYGSFDNGKLHMVLEKPSQFRKNNTDKTLFLPIEPIEIKYIEPDTEIVNSSDITSKYISNRREEVLKTINWKKLERSAGKKAAKQAEGAPDIYDLNELKEFGIALGLSVQNKTKESIINDIKTKFKERDLE